MPDTSPLESVTLNIPTDVLDEIDTIAGATKRSRGKIILRALRTYLLNEGADIIGAIRGKEEIERGELEDIDDVIADMDRIIAGKVA